MRASLSGVVLLGVAACSIDPGPQPNEEEPTPSEPRTLVAPAEVVAVPNLDDDDGDGVSDWEGPSSPYENDRQAMTLESGPGQIALTLSGEARVWLPRGAGGDPAILLLDDETPSVTLDTTGTLNLTVELPDFVSEASLSVRWTGSGDQEGQSGEATVALRGAPLILNHHLQAAEMVYAMSSSSNEEMIAGFTDTLGDYFTGYALRDYGRDVWIQDEFEFGTATSPNHRLDVVLDSIRTQNDNWLDPLAEEQWAGPDVYIHTWGDGRASAQDYFGNLELTPPLTANGVSYPFGRIYYGAWDSELSGGGGPHQDLRDLLDAQGVQDPFTLDVRWLCVGHVDEFMSFIPDPTAPRGFRLVFADTRLGRSFLEGLDAETSLPRFARGHGYDTIGAMLEDEELWAYNDEVQAVYLDAYLETLRAEIELTEDEIIAIPAAFEQNDQCGGYGLALIPGTANLTVAQPDPDGPVHLFFPDPFLREDTDDPGSDPFIAYVNALLPAAVEPHWLDDWELYHMAWGEVHCGSNARRTPTDEAWTLTPGVLE